MAQNLAEIESSVGRYGIDCGWELTGSLSVATEPHQVEWLREASEGTYLDQDAVRDEIIAARRLYEAEGFAQVGRRRGYYDAGRVDAVVMRKELPR